MNTIHNTQDTMRETVTGEGHLRRDIPMLKDLSQTVDRQLNEFLSLYDGRRDPETMERFRNFAETYLGSRFQRGNELDAPELNEARTLKDAFHGPNNHFFLVTCIDGRNMPTVMFTFVPHSNGGFIRTQAGDLSAFQVLQNSEDTRLDPQSDFHKALDELIKRYPGAHIYYGLDSHVGCAARGLMSGAQGKPVVDGGLRDDVTRKRKIAQELIRFSDYMKVHNPTAATLTPDPFSYDPHQGTMVMGLKKYIDDAGEEGFTEEFRTQLITEGKIIDTWELLHDEKVIFELERCVSHTADFRTDYPQSVLENWRAITAIYDNGNGYVYTMLMGRLQSIYGDEHDDEVLAHKAKLLIKNLVTRWSIGRNDHKWEFDKHNERMISISERAFGPYNGPDHFMVSSFEGEDSVMANLLIANGLLRDFRAKGSIIDSPTDILMIDNQATVKSFSDRQTAEEDNQVWEQVGNLSFEIFSQIDWDDISVKNWTKDDIDRLWIETVDRHHKVITVDAIASRRISQALWELFSRMRTIMLSQFAQHLHETSTVVMNTLYDGNGRPRVIVPLVPHLLQQ
ncbi:hypothetical protein KBC70_04850 [Candidatus Woesebacteria bacterium]|nr:hypothetical protein [Candidatus Woesebacteria bacterium]